MKKIIGLFVVLLCASVMAADLTVAVTLQPYANIAQYIGGTRINVVAMVPPGADPHSYEPKPAVLKEFAKADVYFSDGSGMDKAWLPRFMGVNKNVKVAFLSKNIDWILDRHDNDLDPHLWTSPKQAVTIAQNVTFQLCAMDTAGRSYYTRRLTQFINRMDVLEERLTTAVSKLPKNRRTFVVFHPSYGYFARDYGLTQLSIEIDGKEPKPKDLATVIIEAKKRDVHLVFVQPQFSKRSAQTLAKQLDAVVMPTDPLDYDFVKNINFMIDAMEGVVKKESKKNSNKPAQKK
ncbi:metal ABC transporter solute-binding protein, Zn/Mn family [Fibrobacter sp.]|uniref:metal ABC transporter solute-binding protein, Zn/Mn family n=1 Tax=Fibrobacter sp. TaxID=35828 RepID=UPI00388D871B